MTDANGERGDADDAIDGDEDGDAAADGSLHPVASVDELDDAERVVTTVEGREVAVFRVDGEYHALSNYCVHQGGPVCEGLLSGGVTADADGELVYDMENRVVSCPWHGWEFDVETGEHLARPQYRLPTYETVVRDGEVCVRL